MPCPSPMNRNFSRLRRMSNFASHPKGPTAVGCGALRFLQEACSPHFPREKTMFRICQLL